MITSKTRILSCILGIILTIGVCEAVHHSDTEIQVDKGDFATFAYKDEWFRLVKDSSDSDFEAIGEISHFIKEGIDVNITDESGNSALYYAVTKNKPNLLKALLKCEKLKIDLPLDESRNTALHLTAESKDKLEIFKQLLNHKNLDTNTFNREGESALFHAITYSNTEAVKLLIEKEPDIINKAIHTNGKTALYVALSDSVKEDLFKVLIDAGADIDVINPYGEEKKTVIKVAEETLKKSSSNNLLKAKIALLKAAQSQKKSSQVAVQSPSTEEKWFKAIEDNDISETRRMIASKIDVNTADNSSLRMTALHIATRDPQKAEIAKLLMQQPLINVNAVDVLGETPLFEAIKSKNKEIVKCLLKHDKINLEMCNKSHMTLFYTAVLESDLPTIELLSKDNRIKIDSHDERLFLKTSLHFAVTEQKQQNADVTDFLLKNSLTDICARDSKGKTPLHLATHALFVNATRTILSHLKKRKIKLSNQEYKDLLHMIDRGSSYSYPKRQLYEMFMEHVLSERAAPCSKKDRLEWMDAEQNNNLAKMERMIKNGFDINVICGSGGTALYNAVSNGNIKTIDFLLKNGADINVCGPWGYTPLWVAAILRKNKELLEILLKHPEADVNDPQDALLYNAVMKGAEDIVKLLLSQKGIDVNFTVSGGWTPLHTAACQNNSGITELLLQQAEINVNAVDDEKKTPLHIAVENNNKEAVESLLKKETIDVALPDTKQLTPLDTAVQQSNAEITLLLLRKTEEKGLKISNTTYEKINQNPNFHNNDEIHRLADRLK